jgi:hypothetical protein
MPRCGIGDIFCHVTPRVPCKVIGSHSPNISHPIRRAILKKPTVTNPPEPRLPESFVVELHEDDSPGALGDKKTSAHRFHSARSEGADGASLLSTKRLSAEAHQVLHAPDPFDLSEPNGPSTGSADTLARTSQPGFGSACHPRGPDCSDAIGCRWILETDFRRVAGRRAAADPFARQRRHCIQ